jgi:hypothetical protein
VPQSRCSGDENSDSDPKKINPSGAVASQPVTAN